MCIEKEKRNNNSSKSTQATHKPIHRKNQNHRKFARQQHYRKVPLFRSASDPHMELRRREEKSLLKHFTKHKLSKEEVVKRANEAVKIADDAVAYVTPIVTINAARIAALVAATAVIDALKNILPLAKVAIPTAVAVSVANRGAATARRVWRAADASIRTNTIPLSPGRCRKVGTFVRKSLQTLALEDALDDAQSTAGNAAKFARIFANIAEIITVSALAAISATTALVSAKDAEKTAEMIGEQSLIANQKAVEIADGAYHFTKRFLRQLNSYFSSERRTQIPPPPLPQIPALRQQYQNHQPQCSSTHDRYPYSSKAIRAFPWATQNNSSKIISQIHEEICEQLDSIKNNVFSKLEINEMKDKLDESIRAILSEKFELEIYGSYRTGLCLPTSDLDLCLVCDPSYNKWQSDDERMRIMQSLNKLENETWVRQYKPLLKAKHPVIKFIGVLNNAKQVKIDITVEFKKQYGIPCDPCLAADLMLHYKEQYPYLEPMALIVKQFFISWGFNDAYRGYPNSYCIVLMIVTFLGYAYGAYSANEHTLGGFLIDFFNFYGNYFNYQQMGIRYDYKEKFHLIAPIDDVRSSCYWGPSLVIDDPIVEGNNVASNVSQFPEVKRAFQEALSNFQFLKNSRVATKSYLKAFLDKKISLQRHIPVQSSSYNMHISRQYTDQRAPRWESIPVHPQAGYYVPSFFPEADHTFFQPQILSSGPYY